MAADPSIMDDPRSGRAFAGVGVALLIVATVGAVALLAPRFREEFREDIFSGPSRAPAPVAASVPPRVAAPVVAAPAVPAVPAVAAVPQASLAPGESVVTGHPAAAELPKPVLRKATRLASKPRTPPKRTHTVENGRNTRGAVVSRSHASPLPPPALRPSHPRTWRPGTNRDAPSSSPTDPQPGA